ncbi:MAG: class I SAM-dependent methyltransferase [Deltaproteobacteria bacterium]|nr:class I SAM-dependent methyltransferase [Deltaproteobacteria bacterium]
MEADLVDRALLESGGSVPDVGSSETWFSDSLQVKPTSYRAIDPEAPKGIQPEGRATAIYGLAEDLPAKDGSARMILYRGRMDHFMDVPKSLQEARRVLEEDGLLLISLSNKNAALRWVRWIRNTLQKTPHYDHLDWTNIWLGIHLSWPENFCAKQDLTSSSNEELGMYRSLSRKKNDEQRY